MDHCKVLWISLSAKQMLSCIIHDSKVHILLLGKYSYLQYKSVTILVPLSKLLKIQGQTYDRPEPWGSFNEARGLFLRNCKKSLSLSAYFVSKCFILKWN